MKDYDKNKNHCIFKSQKLPLGHFKWVEETYEFNEDFIKSYNDESDMMKRIFSGS